MRELSHEFVAGRLKEIFNQAANKEVGSRIEQELNKYDISEELISVINAQIAYFAEEAYRQGYEDGLNSEGS